MVVAFASVRRWHEDLPLQLVTNEPPPVPYRRELANLDVTITLQAFDHAPPVGFSKQFAGSLYMLDAVRACRDQDTVFIDPDVVCVRPLDAMLTDVGATVGAMPLNYPPDTSIGGLSLAEAGELHALLGEPSNSPPVHFGGECYIVPASWAPVVLDRAQTAWAFSLARHSDGQTRFPTEEHIFSYAFLGVPITSLRPHVRRIWTSATYRTIHGDEPSMTIWHLPSEKGNGISSLYKLTRDPDSWFWTSENAQFMSRIGRTVGVTARTPRRLARDTAAVTLHRAAKVLGHPHGWRN